MSVISRSNEHTANAEILGGAKRFSELGIEESLRIFSMLYAGSRTASALIRPITGDDDLLDDAEILATNGEWQAARAFHVEPGSKASDVYTDWDGLKALLQRARAHGSATQLFNSGTGDSRVRGGILKEVEWRLLPNDLIIETARDQTLLGMVAETSGPVLVVNIEDEGPPTRIIQMNQAFADMFLSGFNGRIPTFANKQPQRDLALSDIRAHVRKHFLDEDWDSFDRRTKEIYTEGIDVNGDPFYLDGQAYLRDYYVRPVSGGKRVGLWVYRPAGQLTVNQLPEFAHSRLMAVRAAVERLSRPIAAHTVILDDDGKVADISLLWANRAWQNYRATDLPRGALGSESRVRFTEDLLPYLKRAWTLGESTQYFRFTPNDADSDVYRQDYVTESSLEIETIFSRTDDDFMMEWGDDVDLKVKLGSDMEAQRQAAIDIALDAQQLAHLAAVALGLVDGANQQGALDLLQVLLEAEPLHQIREAFADGGAGLDLHVERVAPEDHRSLSDGGQLAEVARPAVKPQRLQLPRRGLGLGATQGLRAAVQPPVQQQEQVVWALPKRRHGHDQDGQAVVQLHPRRVSGGSLSPAR